MGRLLVFIVIIVAALAGAWFYVPGGKDMLLGAKEMAMGFMPGKAEEAAPAEEAVVEEAIAEDAAGEDAAAEEAPAEEAPAEAAPQN
jgi:hypothetical protein